MATQISIVQRRGVWTDYLQLTKPRIAALLVFTSVSALIVAFGGWPSVSVMIGTVLGGWLAAAGASVLNQYLERDLDTTMKRTRSRPLPSGRISPANALVFGLGLLLWSILIFLLFVNPLAAGLALAGAVYYVLVYTLLLKRNTVLNVVIGGGAGAFPVLVGWSAATGRLEVGALLLFTIVLFWTPPHSWALALLIKDDYERGTIPMMPVVRSIEATTVYIFWYTLHLIALTLIVYGFNLLGEMYLVNAVLLGGGLLWYTARLMNDYTKKQARQLYKYSSLYLLLLFLGMILDVLIF